MDNDRFWLCPRLDNDEFITSEYMITVKDYIKFALSTDWFVSGDRVRCPCLNCQKHKFL